MEIAPFRGLRFNLASRGQPEELTAPPYDVISPAEHGRLLEASPHNITLLTLGSVPGEASSYEERGRLLREWIDTNVLIADASPCFYVYAIDYTAPGSGEKLRMLGLIAVGRLYPFEAGVVLPHERTFPKVVDDRHRLLTATHANLESIFLLYSDPERRIDSILERSTRDGPALRVEARPGEVHALYPVSDVKVAIHLTELMKTQRPIIADGHHRYTTSLKYSQEAETNGSAGGAGWQMMTFTNLFGSGLSILATHRAVKLAAGSAGAVLAKLRERLEPAGEGDWELSVETAGESLRARFPGEVRKSRRGVSRTSYALLHDVVIEDWLRSWVGPPAEILYFKEGTGEDEALRSGRADLLFRMRPVSREEFQSVVRGGELFPHKTTFFYPKLRSGLVMWELEEPEPLALK
jgi:uncharacterized protein (DUF1015 family)